MDQLIFTYLICCLTIPDFAEETPIFKEEYLCQLVFELIRIIFAFEAF